ncbi:hypothetical protein P4908_04985 [Pantoea ananatis]|uniref:hypothetical protein n=1 Tax=Pantoea ananas TaxID=553 RepID=UPI0023F9B2AB|nr:hypothetical protein [Pantoea ananatis]MDF7789602.1 hypothetical protein [Pantoea ananatis]
MKTLIIKNNRGIKWYKLLRVISGPDLSSDYIGPTFAAPPQVSAAFFIRKAKLFLQNPGHVTLLAPKKKGRSKAAFGLFLKNSLTL